MAGVGDVKTVQWAPGAPQQQPSEISQSVAASKVPQASTGACDACRSRKVRCLANESSMSSKCQRCAKAGRECIYTVHSKTRRRKRTDTRVKELEEKVRSLSMLLEKGNTGSKLEPKRRASESHDPDDEGMGDDDDDEEEWSDDDEGNDHLPHEECDPASGNSNNFDGHAAFQGSAVNASSAELAKARSAKAVITEANGKIFVPTGSVSPDVVERGVVSMEKAQEMFDRYKNDLSPNYPGVYFPPETSAATMRKQRPVLFLSIIAAGAGDQDPALNLALNQEILQVYANKVAINGEKSLEFEELKFHQYIHMAATMALDIGLGKRPRAPRAHEDGSGLSLNPDLKKSSDTTSSSSMPFPDSALMECRRTLLACYLSCSSVSMSLRLPNMLRFTSWMNDCLNALETSPEAAPTDKRFAAWIRIQHLVEECVIAFSLDDPGNTVSLSDDRVQQMLKGFEKQLEDMKKSMNAIPGLLNDFLEINFYVNNIYIHEIALHPEHDSEDFRPPFFVAATSTKTKTVLGPAYLNAIAECVTSAQKIIKIFIGMHIEVVRSLPAILYVRIIYSAIILIKLDVSANSPESEIGKILDRDSLLTRPYIEKVLIQMRRVAGNDKKNILGAKFCMILAKLVLWYRQNVGPGAIGGQQQEPLQPAKAFNDTHDPEDISPDPQPSAPTFAGDSMAEAMAAQPMPHPASTFTSFSSFSGAPQYPTPGHSPFSTEFLLRNSAPERQTPFTQAPLNQGTPNSAMDYSSPELMEQAGAKFDFSMDVDPSMFNQLQGADPFTYNQDPNDWMFDGMDYSNIANVPDFDWNSIPGPL